MNSIVVMNKIFSLVIFFSGLFQVTCGQSSDTLEVDSILTFIDPEGPPSYPGGLAEFGNYLKKNLKWKQDNRTAEGKVYVEFFVEVDGTITDVKIVRGLSQSCDKEALRLVRAMPKWIPGTWYQKPRRVKMVLPIEFKQ